MEAAKKAVVIGGGYVGLEVAASLATRGLSPEVVLMEPHVMARLWNGEIAAKYEALFETRGTKFHRSSRVKQILAAGDGKARGVELEDGSVLECDLVVVGVGATAPLGPFEGQLNSPENARLGGIRVDGQFRASGAGVEPGSVYAIGDIAAFPLKLTNEIVRMEHVKHARDSATFVGNIIAGALDANAEYDYTPYFYSRVFEHPGSPRAVSWVFFGLQHGDIITVGDLDPKLAAFWIDEHSKCVGVMLESGSPDQISALASAVRSAKYVDVDALRAAASVDDALALIL
jgi:monodehydroascorbate reductase (NADH)